MSTELDKLALMMITMENARKMHENTEPVERRAPVRTRKSNIRIQVGNAMIAVGQRLKSAKHARAGAM